jgi:hypothetical protein
MLRAARPPRLVPLDAFWMIVLALIAVTVSTLLVSPSHGVTLGVALEAVTVVLLYLLGWRARDRSAGLIAALLAATSLPFAVHAASVPLDTAFVLLATASLFSFVAGSSLIALGFAGLAAAARPDGLLLGLVLFGLALAQGRRRAGLGALAFAVLAGIGWAIRSGLGQGHFPTLILGTEGWLGIWAITGGTAMVSWLLLPFFAELGEAPRRARWLPVALWALSYFVVESFVHAGDRNATLFGLMPVLFALAGGGLSRLLPALTGDIPLPWMRYGLATVAVLALLAICGRPWSVPKPPSVPVVSPAALSVPMPAAPIKPVPTVKPASIIVPAAAAVAAHHATAPNPTVSKPAAPKAALKPVPKVPAKASVKPVLKPAAKAHPVAHVSYRLSRPRYPRRYIYRRWYRR